MLCDQAVPAVASIVAGEVPASRRQHDHVNTCLHCQAAVARDRRLRRSLAELRGAMVVPRPELLPELLLAVRDAATERADESGRTRRLLYLGAAGVAATAAAGGGVALAVASRRRRPRVLAASLLS